MAPRIIIFTGAPDARSLNWDETFLLTNIQPQLAQFCGLEGDWQTIAEASSASYPSWCLQNLHQSNFTTDDTDSSSKTQLLVTDSSRSSQESSLYKTSRSNTTLRELSQHQISQELSLTQSVEQVISQFYEESHTRHEDIELSLTASTVSTIGSSFSDKNLFENPSLILNVPPKLDIPIYGYLTDLKDIPTASYLDSIYPQTLTFNIIVGLISICQARVIKTRRGATVELIEILVGDETKTGFTINFWLPPLSSRHDQGDMRSLLCELQTHDIILVQNMALSSFRGKVYGQSLRRDLTKIHLIYRHQMNHYCIRSYYDSGDILDSKAIHSPQVEKMMKVREWLTKFVGVSTAMTKTTGNVPIIVKEVLPPDTQ